jgi:hypothetical protein
MDRRGEWPVLLSEQASFFVSILFILAGELRGEEV